MFVQQREQVMQLCFHARQDHIKQKLSVVEDQKLLWELGHGSDSARGLEVLFDWLMTLDSQIGSVCPAAHFHLRATARVKG